MIARNAEESNAPPAGWRLVTLQGGPHNGHRLNLHESEDRATLYERATPHSYYEIGKPGVLVHERLVFAAFGGRAKR